MLAFSPDRLRSLAARTLEAAWALSAVRSADPLAADAVATVLRVELALGDRWWVWFVGALSDTSMTSWAAAPPSAAAAPVDDTRGGSSGPATESAAGQPWPELPAGAVVVTGEDLAAVFGEQVAADLDDLAVFYTAAAVSEEMGFDVETGTGGPLSASLISDPEYASPPLIVSSPSVEAAAAAGTVVVATVVTAGPDADDDAEATLDDYAAAAEAAGVETVIPVGEGGVVHLPQDEGHAAGAFPVVGAVEPLDGAFAAMGLSVQYRLGSDGGYEARIVAESWPPGDLDADEFASYEAMVTTVHETAVPRQEDQMMASALDDLMGTVNNVISLGQGG